jgi:SAM-dependent methyltransferase
MSSYEDYTATSAHYDATREPIGVEVILGCLARGTPPLSEQTLIDAGCGTGNYSLALLEHVGRIEAVDMNDGMLEVARAKLAEAEGAGRIGFHRAAIDSLPFDSISADAVMINQVLHHLPDEPSKGWPLTRKVIGEFARVLRPGGVLVVNFCSHEQLRRGWWFFPLIEPAAERMIERHALLLELESMIVASGFELCGRFVPTDAVIQGQSYYDPRGPLDATWRAGDSVWAMLSPEEVEAVEERVRDMDARGELENFVANHDSDRLNVGQTTFLCARRR